MFWKNTALKDLNDEQWESLCDGCGKCCLIKLEDEDSGEVVFTNMACKLLDVKTCKCSDYTNRAKFVPDCIKMTHENIGQYGWLPKTCAYRLIDEGKPLPDWHPLITGDPKTVVRAGASAMGRIVSEVGIDDEQAVNYIVRWPNR
ncbi:MAG: YcgN family cysteine cluster protein [Rhizobiales bacterium]|nr:YcgN family cysteine cluster protein [Hyphomicrobiales bacterium]NRB13397.1 YcgN family cysteine cluster protein [Hyphomicrobiales bacterium]